MDDNFEQLLVRLGRELDASDAAARAILDRIQADPTAFGQIVTTHHHVLAGILARLASAQPRLMALMPQPLVSVMQIVFAAGYLAAQTDATPGDVDWGVEATPSGDTR